MDTREQRREAYFAQLEKIGAPRMAIIAQYSSEQADKILERLVSYKNIKGLTQSRLAGLVGISDGSLSPLLNGKYSGDEQGQLAKIEQFLDREIDRAEKPCLTRFVDTSVSKDIFRALKQNQTHGTMGAVIGEAGIGKTRSFQEYALRTSNVLLISAAEWLSTPAHLSRKLAELVLTERRRQTFHERCEAIVDKLRGTARLIIIDQAHQITDRGHQFLQNLWDQCNPSDEERYLGVVFGCTWRFYHQIHAARGHYWYEQLTSRMDAGTNKKIGKSPFKLADIEALFSRENLKFELTAEGARFLLNVANSAGGLRSAVANVDHLQHLFVKKGLSSTTKLTADNLKSTQEFMLRDDTSRAMTRREAA